MSTTTADVAVSETQPPPPSRAPRTRFSINIRQSGIYIAFAFIVALFTVLTGGDLLQPQNISNIIVQYSFILILAIGMILIIIAGHIDLSVGSVVAVTGALSAVLMVNMHVPWLLALAITLLAGGLIGAWQAFWIAYFGIPAFIVTLAGMLVFRALTMMVLGNQGIGSFPEPVRTLSNGFTEGYLGNIGLGPLGGADLFSILVAVPRSPACSPHSGGRAVPGWVTTRPSSRCSCSSPSSSAAPPWCSPSWSSWPATRTSRGCWCCWRSWYSGTPCSRSGPSSVDRSMPSAATSRRPCCPA